MQGQLPLTLTRIGLGIEHPLLLQPLQGGFQGLLPALEQLIEHRMRLSAAIGEPVEPLQPSVPVGA